MATSAPPRSRMTSGSSARPASLTGYNSSSFMDVSSDPHRSHVSSAPSSAPPVMPMLHASASFDAEVTAATAQQRDRASSWGIAASDIHRQVPGAGYQMLPDASKKLTREMEKAVQVVETFLSPTMLKDQSIPRELLTEAYGLVFLTVYKLGFLFSGKVGHGFVISRTTGGWSAPLFISSGGLGFGMMAGGEVVTYMIILNSRSAVKVFTRNGQVQLGSELDIAVGPIGRAASAALNVGRAGIAPNYSYSHSKGLYGGIGLSGAVIYTRKSMNARCYGPRVTARQILGGEVPCTHAVPLWQAVDRALQVQRQYRDGFPVLQATSSGVTCLTCGHSNPMESETCEQCQRLLVYSVSVHLGKFSAGELVLSKDMVQGEQAQSGMRPAALTGHRESFGAR